MQLICTAKTTIFIIAETGAFVKPELERVRICRVFKRQGGKTTRAFLIFGYFIVDFMHSLPHPK